MKEWTDGWTNGRRDKRTDGRMGGLGWVDKFFFIEFRVRGYKEKKSLIVLLCFRLSFRKHLSLDEI